MGGSLYLFGVLVGDVVYLCYCLIDLVDVGVLFLWGGVDVVYDVVDSGYWGDYGFDCCFCVLY